MHEQSSLPNIEVLSSFNPQEKDGSLYSPNLKGRIQEYSPYEGAMWEAFLATTPGDLEELNKAKKLADYYHLRTAERLQNTSRDKMMWAHRFNQAGEEIYGSVNTREVAKIAVQELEELENSRPISYAAQIYRQLIVNVEALEDRNEASEQLEVMRGALFTHFSNIAEVISALPEGPYDSASVRNVFMKVLQRLAQEDAGWSEWTITNTEGKTMLSVVAANKQVEVPDGRGPIASKEQLFGLAMHEIGVHAQRAVNGYKTGDEMMALGLPGYIDFEEGLGVFFEYLATDRVPDKIKDRYIDIALATGAVNGIMLTREELIELGIDRGEARARIRGEVNFSSTDIRKAVTNHINRIFRGGDGIPIRSLSGSVSTQPVFNKDLVYYEGFIKARDFAIEQLDNSLPANELLEFLLQGKFDPTDPDHLAYVGDKHSPNL